MYEVIDAIQGQVLALRLFGEITDKEQTRLDARLQKRIDRWGRIRLLIATRGYTSFNSAEDLFFDLQFVWRHADRIDRMAVIGDRDWRRTWVGLFGLFSGIDSAFFTDQEVDAAVEWVVG